MFIQFFLELKKANIPVSILEFITFLSALEKKIVIYDIEGFYYLARITLIKNEKNIDKFDIVFHQFFEGIKKISLEKIINEKFIPSEWLKKLSEKFLNKEEIEKLKSTGSFEDLMKTLQKRLDEQVKRHQGGNKWIGTAGTSPFGAYGYNPEGIRIGQNQSRHRKAVKVWDKRKFRDLNENEKLKSRGIKLALKRLRVWASEGIEKDVDINETISTTAKKGFLDIKLKRQRENIVKILIFFDIGGSMDDHIEEIQELFLAARDSFKNLEYYYFHNCLYEGVWKDSDRRWDEKISTNQIINTFGKEYKCIFVGDASMSPYEIEVPGGGNEHYNDETGRVWLERAIKKWPKNLWINPVQKENWQYSQSTQIIMNIFENKMVPLTLEGLDAGMKVLN